MGQERKRLRLEKLTEDKVSRIADKKICCYEKSMQYLQELVNKYHVLAQIEYIIDDNTRMQGKCILMDKEITVYPSDYLQEIDWKETILLITSDYYVEVYEKLCENDFLKSYKEVVYYFANRETEYEENYRECYRNSSLEDIIIFRSGPHASSYVKGMDFADNARALFEYMVKNSYNERYKLVWLVKNPEEFARWSNIHNVEFLSFDWSLSEIEEERDKYYHALCLAKYIFFTDAYGFARNCRKDQVRVQLWHGCGFKTRVNFVRCEKRYEYTTVVSDLYAQIHQDIYGLRADQMLVTGYAKEDWLFHPTTKDYKRIFDIPQADKCIFWLPTFRTAKENLSQLNEYMLESATGFPIVETIEQLVELNRLLVRNGIVLIIKLHPFQEKSMVCKMTLSNVIMIDNEKLFENDIQINELLGEAHALISDYSSAAIDYLLLDRPMAFTLDDVKEYEESRGFVFDNIKEWLPGAEVYSFEELCSFVLNIAEGRDITAGKRRELRGKMHKYHDDQSSRRILEALNIMM